MSDETFDGMSTKQLLVHIARSTNSTRQALLEHEHGKEGAHAVVNRRLRALEKFRIIAVTIAAVLVFIFAKDAPAIVKLLGLP